MNKKKQFEDKHIVIKSSICNSIFGYIENNKLDMSASDESLTNLECVLSIYESDDDMNIQNLIGEIHLTYLDSDMIHYVLNMSDYDLFDLRDGDICGIYPLIYDEYDILKEQFIGSESSDFIYVDEIFIKKEFRNMGIGTKIIKKLPDIIRNYFKFKVGCIFLYAKPSEITADGHTERIDDKYAQEKLIKFYETCGFNRIENTGYMYFNTDFVCKE